MSAATSRRIGASDRSGALDPANLARFSAWWVEPGADVRDVVDTYWSVEWALADGEEIRQRIIDHLAITLTVEEGDVPAPLVVSSARSAAWSRVIRGSGRVFALRLRPAGLAVLSGLDPAALDGEHPLTPAVDARAHALLDSLTALPDAYTRAARADELVRRFLAERPPSDAQLLANRAIDRLTEFPELRRGGQVAAELGVSERALQRALRSTVGRGPREVARRIRLQEVVRRLSIPDAVIAEVAADLGYVDQAHLTNDFRAATGVTPGRYLRELADAAR